MDWVERFWSKISPEGAGCREWLGTRFDSGYGAFHLDGRLQRAHRLMWMLHYGEIPPGMLVCHHCDNPPCVEITHLFLGTPRSNMADKVAKGRLVASPRERNGMWGKRKEACKHGHPLAGHNLLIVGGDRRCRACRYAANERWRQRQKEKAGA